MTFLDNLSVGQSARIAGVGGDGDLLQRLLEMGFVEGEEVEVLRVAPLGDPIEFRLGGYRVSLRRREAARVRVTPND